MPRNSETIRAIESQLTATTERMRRELNAQLYADGGYVVRPVPVTWIDRLHRRWQRVQSYFSTLWSAVRGRDPYDYDRDDY